MKPAAAGGDGSTRPARAEYSDSWQNSTVAAAPIGGDSSIRPGGDTRGSGNQLSS